MSNISIYPPSGVIKPLGESINQTSSVPPPKNSRINISRPKGITSFNGRLFSSSPQYSITFYESSSPELESIDVKLTDQNKFYILHTFASSLQNRTKDIPKHFVEIIDENWEDLLA